MKRLLAAVLLVAACSGGGPSVEEFCDQLIAIGTLDVSLDDVDLSDRDAVVNSLTQFRRELELLAEAAPDDIATDTDTVARFGIALAQAAIDADPDDPFDRAALLATAAASEPDIEDATERLATYASRNCTAAPGG